MIRIWMHALVIAGLVLVPAVGRAQESSQAKGRPLMMTTAVSQGRTANADPRDAQDATSKRVSMDFQDASLKDVLKIFSQQTGINVIAGEEVAQRTITLYLEDVAPLDALDQILSAAGLIYERAPQSQIYIVKPKPAPEAPQTLMATMETRVYRLKFARVSTSQLAKVAAAFGSVTPFEAKQLSPAGSSSGTTSGTTGTSGTGTTDTSSTTTKKDIGIDQVVKELLTEEGKVVVDERTNSLVVTDRPENFPRIESVLKTLDIQTAQILIEAELLETTLSKLKDVGISWGTGSSGTLATLTGATRSTRFPFSTLFGEKSGSATSVTLGTINTGQVNAVLDALERDADTKILARPKVLTLDNESAVIKLSSLQAVATQTTTLAANAPITSTTPERMTTGVILVVTPQVNTDGFITMMVEPSVTKVVSSQIDTKIKDPKTRSARALVRIRQGETLVLGGLIDRSEAETVQEVPILSRIPIVGEAFKHKELDRSASELIVFVTPRILPEASGTQMAPVGQAPFPSREQEGPSPRHDVIEQTLNRLERPSL